MLATSDQITPRLPDACKPLDPVRMVLSSNVFKLVGDSVYRFEPEDSAELQLHDSKARSPHAEHPQS